MAHAARSDAGDRIRILGAVEIVRAGRPISAGSPRQRALLALLALSVGVAVPPSRLVDLLWGESPPPAAGNTVQVYVSRLRRLLATPGELPPLRTVSGMYLLDLPPEAIDARRFEEASESGRARLAAGDPVGAAHELRSALQLWRGWSLPDLVGVPGALASVARLQSLRLSTLADRIDAESLLGRHSRLIPELQDLVRRHPLNERFVGQLMTSLYWEGRQAEALAAYAAAAGRLGDELGIDPAPPLRDLHGRLLRQEVGPVATGFSGEMVKTDSESDISVDLTSPHLAPRQRVIHRPRSGDAILPETESFSEMVSCSAPAGSLGSHYPHGSHDSHESGHCPGRPTVGGGPFGDQGSGGVAEGGSAGSAGSGSGRRIPGQRTGPALLPGGVRSPQFRVVPVAFRPGPPTGLPLPPVALPGPPVVPGSPGGPVVPGGPDGPDIPGVLGGSGVPSGPDVLGGPGVLGSPGSPGAGQFGGSGPLGGAERFGGAGQFSGAGQFGGAGQARGAGQFGRTGRFGDGGPSVGATRYGAVGSFRGGPVGLEDISGRGEAYRARPAPTGVPALAESLADTCAPVLPGVPDTGAIATIGTKRTAFGTAFGAGTVGRTAELNAALDLLRRPDVRLVTVVGPGGAGKTRLAAQVVTRRLAEQGRGSMPATRILVVPLDGAEPGGLAARLRRVLGVVPDTPGEAPIDTICRALSATGCLLVLDDLDLTLNEGEPVATVRTLIDRVGGLRVLATARRVLGVPEEQVVGLGPLPLPWAFSGAGDVETVRSSEAVRLFRERARAVRPAFEVTEQNAGAVGDLCRTLDGLPLALELAAARTRGKAPAGIGEELGEVALPALGGHPGLALGVVLNWTTDLLDATERLVLSQLSVFAGGATLDAAERVCGPVPGPGQVIDVIGRLADKNLLLIDETGRLGLLSPVREHARRLLAADPDEETACADRHAAYFAEFAEALPPLTDRWLDPADGPGRQQSAGSRGIEYDNLTAAAAHAEGRDGEVFARLVVALLDQGATTGRWELGDAPAWLDRAQAQRPTARTGARLLLAGGSLALFGGDPRAAARIFARVPAGATSGEAGDVVAIRVALVRAAAARTLGRSEEALAELEGAMERLRAVRRLPEVLWHAVVNTLADVLDDLGRTGPAIGHWQRSRHRAAAGGDSARLAYPLAKLALAGQDRGEQSLARVLIGQAQSAAQLGGPAIRAGVAVASGVLELRDGDSAAAVESLRTALREAHRGGRFVTLPRIAGLLGVAHRPEDPERAAALLAASAAWCAQRSIVICGWRDKELIAEAEAELTRSTGTGRPSDEVRRAAARGAAVPFGSLIGLAGLLRIDPCDPPRLIDLTGQTPVVHS